MSDELNMPADTSADDQTNAGDTASGSTSETDAKPASKKKTTKKKASTKKTAKKKAASKKKTAKKAAKKTAKKTAKKKAAKKKAAKKTSKKAASKGEPEEDAVDEAAIGDEAEPAGEDGDELVDEEAGEQEADQDDDQGDGEKPARKTRSRKKTASKTSGRSSRSGRSGRSRSLAIEPSDLPAKERTGPKPFARLAVNYVPGEECRVALVEDGLLQEYEAERFDAISRVGNIYLGRVKNIETGIQAAFVDFGVEEAGFLHVSDLHPSLFPGEDGDTTERVGKKTPRRERPPIEKALKRGQQILVQVLKDGVGTKGPALTSYLSIPGRFLVMMPQMDKVGVSRKVDDDDQRRDMRKILDQLDLPDGFGFILRTAGMGRTKTELKRDLAYLQRLWKDLERKKRGNAPRLLYSESDLLVRTLRDQVNSEIDEVVIDSDRALQRAAEFIKIVAPKSVAKVKRYEGQTPLFNALGIEHQISNMHAREVPLPSGGRLVIDQTEALVAIDVNSGRMRSRDNDTNAVRCNLEAADEICRQLRLRDLGGLVINDLIDMRHARHRNEVEQRFAENLRRDKSKSTILPISEFGIMEMTRQRQSASHESKHFTECPTCSGRGLVQRPSSVADDALRSVEHALTYDSVSKVELVVSARVAGELLSSRRIGIGRIERATGKHVEVRVSDALRLDQVRVYAYDQNGSDIDLERASKGRPKPEKHIVEWEPEGAEDWAADVEDEREELLAEAVEAPEIEDIETPGLADKEDEPGGKKKRRRRRRGRGKGRGGEGFEDQQGESGDNAEDAQSESSGESDADNSDGEHGDGEPGEGGKKRRRRRGRRRKSGSDTGGEESSDDSADRSSESSSDGDEENRSDREDDDGDAPKKKRRRRRGRGGRGSGEGGESGGDSSSAGDGDRATYTGKGGRTPRSEKSDSKNEQAPEVTVKKPRSLYGSGRRKLAPSEIPQIGME